MGLTPSLSPQIVSYISALKAKTLLYLLRKCENLLQCIWILTFFFNKTNSVFVILPFEILMNR